MPSCVAFTNDKRLVGGKALMQASKNPINTIFDPKRLIGRNFSDTSVQNDIKVWPFKVVQGPKDMPFICVTFNGAERKFTAEQILAMIFTELKKNAEAHIGSAVKNAVVTVPACFNRQ